MDLGTPQLIVKETGTAKGRGVFAGRAHAAGETVESCPAVLFSGAFKDVPDEVRKLLYHWERSRDGMNTHCLALGYGSLYNHDNPANMRFEAIKDDAVLRFVAIRAIEPGEELTVNYNALSGEHQSSEDVWFDSMGIKAFIDSEPRA